MFAYKENIEISIFFPMLHHGKSLEKPQYNMATRHFYTNSPILPYILHHFPVKVFRSCHIDINFGKVDPHTLPFWEGASNYVSHDPSK